MKDGKFELREWVLVRDYKDDKWCLAQFSHYQNKTNYPYKLIGGNEFKNCIPYEGNENLLGKTDDNVGYYLPKDGEFVSIKSKETDDHSIAIFYDIDKKGQINTYVDFTDGEMNFKNSFISSARILPATEEEKQQLQNELNKVGLEWDADDRQLRQKKWVPKYGEPFYYILPNGDISYEKCWDKADNGKIWFGNYFRTVEEARSMADKFKQLMKGECYEYRTKTI